MTRSRFTVLLPELGEEIESATLAQWLRKVGDSVSPEDDLAELVTDKASFVVPAGRSGVVVELKAREGEALAIGSPLAIIEEQG